MQPCSQPRYGLIDCEKPTSGESLCEMMERALSMVTKVFSSRVMSVRRPAVVERFPRDAFETALHE